MKNRIVPGFELAFESPGNSTGFSVWQLSNLWQRKIRGGSIHMALPMFNFFC